MKRAVAIALVSAVSAASVWAQGGDPLPPEEPPAAGAGSAGGISSGSAAGPGTATGSAAGSAMGSAAGSGTDPATGTGPGSATGSATGSAPGSGTGSGTGSGSGSGAATGSGSGSAAGSGAATGSGSGSAAGSNAPIVIVIPDDVQPPDVIAAASPSTVRLGERFTLFITATYATDVEVNLREPLDLGSSFEIKRKVSSNRTSADGRKVREWQVEVYAWELGNLHVPPLAVTFTSHGKAGQVATNAVSVNVNGVLGDLVDDPKLVRGDTPPVTLMTRDWFWVWVGGGVAAAIAALLTALYLRSKRRRRVRTLIGTLVVSGTTPRRLDMTSERALEQLLAVEQSGVLDRDEDRKSGYAELVGVIREYLGGRYRVATLDLTTAELMRSLGKAAPEDERHQVAAWLERCDIVKYGGMRATADDARGVLDGARTLVMTTTRAPGREASKAEAVA